LKKSLAASEAKNQEATSGREKKRGEQKLERCDCGPQEDLRQQLAANVGDRERLAKLQQESDAKIARGAGRAVPSSPRRFKSLRKSQAHEDTSLEAFEQPAPEGRAAPTSPTESRGAKTSSARRRPAYRRCVRRGGVTGKTKRTYGRVYYVEKKLLVFYAFRFAKTVRITSVAFSKPGAIARANVGKPQKLGATSLLMTTRRAAGFLP